MIDKFTDVVVIGAGISGISSAYYLSTRCRNKSFTILEGRDSIGGTWDLFRYPGIRSDSDMYTLGFAHRPWTSAKSIADAPSIMKYLHKTIIDDKTDEKIEFNKKVTLAEWHDDDALWHLTVQDTKTQKTEIRHCRFIHLCTGYYNYDQGFQPEFSEQATFEGQLIHPQKWPEDLDYRGKNVVVIGSGATAITIVPAMSETAKNVTMLQRTPTYTVSLPNEDKLAAWMRRYLPAMLAYTITRWQNILFQRFMFWFCRRFPQRARDGIINAIRRELGDDYPVDQHFSPPYNPWEQRLCLAPDADFFEALKNKKAKIITDHIDKFTPNGIALKSGKHLKADIIVSATGLNMEFLGGIDVIVNGKKFDLHEAYTYKGMMYSSLPNFVQSFGYTNASWTLKCDLTSAYVARLLNYMDAHGYVSACPNIDTNKVDEENIIDFSSGYILRALEKLPKQGHVSPWKLHQNYLLDLVALKFGGLKDSALVFEKASAPAEKLPQAAE